MARRNLAGLDRGSFRSLMIYGEVLYLCRGIHEYHDWVRAMGTLGEECRDYLPAIYRLIVTWPEGVTRFSEEWDGRPTLERPLSGESPAVFVADWDWIFERAGISRKQREFLKKAPELIVLIGNPDLADEPDRLVQATYMLAGAEARDRLQQRIRDPAMLDWLRNWASNLRRGVGSRTNGN